LHGWDKIAFNRHFPVEYVQAPESAKLEQCRLYPAERIVFWPDILLQDVGLGRPKRSDLRKTVSSEMEKAKVFRQV
jgi:hypothetical protein